MKSEHYSIKDLEVLSGIKAHTIRIWEKRYNLLNPDRTDTNIRLYSDADLRRILNVSMLVNNGFKISKVAVWEEAAIKNAVLKVSQGKTSDRDYVDRMLVQMLNFDNVGFYKLSSEIIDKLGLEVAVSQVFFELFKRIGTYWQVGSIFPAQEHYVTSIFRQKMIAEIDKLGITNTRNSTILFFLPEKEMHEMSLLFYSYLAVKRGYNIIYLGQLVPFEDLGKIQSLVKIDFVFTAFINSISTEELENYLDVLKKTFHDQKVFITGWQLHDKNPALPRNVKIVKDYHEFKKYLG